MDMCNSKHTKYDPTTEEFNCPMCGAMSGDFYIDESYGVNDCEKLHVNDIITCSKCGYGTTGAKLCDMIIKKNNMVKCECCDGKGYIPE